jgi:iron complex outermembrane receptor protein
MKMNRLLLGLLTAGLIATGSTSPAQTATTTDKAVKLDAVEVLGSRIRRTDMEGPSPVSTYDIDDIRGSGALNLADFLRTIPQTYNGAGSGRNSAPDDLNMFAGQRDETSFLPLTPGTGASPILGNTAPVQTGVSGVSLRGLGSGSTLVLVDGRRVAQAGEAQAHAALAHGLVALRGRAVGVNDAHAGSALKLQQARYLLDAVLTLRKHKHRRRNPVREHLFESDSLASLLADKDETLLHGAHCGTANAH